MKPLKPAILNLSRFVQAKAPALGIAAFSAASINSVANLFLGRAVHPTQVLWASAALVELCTAWLVYQVVDVGRKLTRSNISKQDKRFYAGVVVVFFILSLFPLGLSIAANTLEFGNPGLGVIFPVLSVACAVGLALPDAVASYEGDRAVEREKAKAEKAEKEAGREIERLRLQIEEAERLRLQIEEAERLRMEVETQRAAAVEQLAPAQPVVILSPRQGAQVEAILAVYSANESATLRDLQTSEFIGSDSVASRARTLAVSGGYLEKTAIGYAPNGRVL